jgi:hypothetical protein
LLRARYRGTNSRNNMLTFDKKDDSVNEYYMDTKYMDFKGKTLNNTNPKTSNFRGDGGAWKIASS